MKRKFTVWIMLIPLLAGIYVINQPNQLEHERSDFQNFIQNHPYNQIKYSMEEIDAMPKKDRPDLAMQQNFLMTVDPKLQTVPTDRLIAAYEQTKAMMKAKSFKNGGGSFSPSQNFDQSDNTIQNQGAGIGTLYRSYQDYLLRSGNGSDNSLSVGDAQDSGTIDFPTEDEGVAIADVIWQEEGPDNIGGRTRALMWDPNDPEVKRLWAAGVAGGIWYNDDATDKNSSWQAVNDFLANLAVTVIAYDPTNTQTFYAGTGEGWYNGDAVRGAGIFKSVDGGDTWSLLTSTQLGGTNGDGFAYVQDLVVTGAGTILATTRGTVGSTAADPEGGVYRSTDGGLSWTQVLSERGGDIEIASNGDIYASQGMIRSDGSISRSVNDGVDWVDVTPPGGSPERIEMAIAASASSTTATTVIYAVASNVGDIEWFQKSTDGGANWTNLTIPEYREQSCSTNGRDFARGQAWYDLILGVSPTNPDVVIAGGINVLRSSDGGVNTAEVSYWTGSDDVDTCDDYVHADVHAIAWRPGFPAQAVIGSDGGVSFSPDLGVASDPTFDTHNKNYAVTQFYAVAAENTAGSDYFLAGAQDNGTLQLSTANGLSGVEVTGGDGAFCFVDQDDPTYQITSFVFNSYRYSSNGGVSFSSITNDQSSGRFINPTDYDNVTNILYSAGNTNELKRITGFDTGSPSAQETIAVALNNGQISAVRADANTANRIFVGTGGGGIFRIDNADTATPTVTEITGSINAGFVSSIDIGSSDDELLVTLSSFGVNSVWYSSDGGTNWTNKDDGGHGLPDMPIRWGLFNPTNTAQVLLATELGVWSSNDVTAANPGWEPTNNRLANVRCDMLQYRAADGLVVVGTHGRGVFTTDVFVATPDTSAPLLLSLSPENGESAAPLNPTLELIFDEAIKVGTGNITIRLTSDDSPVQTIDVTSDQVSTTLATASVTLSGDLAINSSYYIEVDNGAFTDNFDNAFGGFTGSSTWGFGTSDGDAAPMVVAPIDNFNVNENSGDIVVDLSAVFDDPDNDNAAITLAAATDNDALVTLDDVSDNELTVSIAAGKIGIATITITATSNGKMVDDVFTVTVSPNQATLFAQGTPGAGNGQLEGMYTDAVQRNADDFVVPSGAEWTVNTVRTEAFSLGADPLNLQSVIVEIYADDAGAPGATLHEQNVLAGTAQIIGGTQATPSLTVRLNTEIVLNPGTYWISIFPQFNAAAFLEGGGFSALYAWFQSTTGGNSYEAASADGAYVPDGQGLGFYVLGSEVINDAPPVFDSPIADIDAAPNAAPIVIDLNNRVSDADNDDSAITFEVFSNSNPALITPDLVDRTLTLTVAPDSEGTADITVRATSNGLTADDTFTVEVAVPSGSLYAQAGEVVGSSPSQIFPDFSNLALESADNFIVPDGDIWNIRKVSVVGGGASPSQAIVFIYDDAAGSVGNLIYASNPLNVEYTTDDTDFEVTLANRISLDAGTYWLSVQTFQAFSGGNQWFWSATAPSVNGDLQWQDLAGLLGSAFTWTPRGSNQALIFDIQGGTCEIPTGLSADNVDGTMVDFSWNATEADSYDVRYRLRFTNDFTTVNNITSNSTTVDLPVGNAEFLVEVRSVCGGVPTKWSPFVIVETEAGSGCAVPNNLMVDNVSGTDIDLSWSDISSADSYDLRYKQRFTAVFTEEIGISTTPSGTVSLPLGNTEYVVEVRAVCGGSATPWSDFVIATTGSSGTGCDVPANLTVDGVVGTDVDVSWDNVTIADSYDLRYRQRFTSVSVEVIGISTTPNATVNLPLGATDYLIEVRSVCGATTTPWSNFVIATTDVDAAVCSTPNNLMVDNVSGTDVDISWSDIAVADSYDLRYKPRGTNDVTVLANVSSTPDATVSFPVGNAEFVVEVRAVCGGNPTPWSAKLVARTGPSVGGCDVPFGLAVDNVAGTDVDISWTNVAIADSYDLRFKQRFTSSFTEILGVSTTPDASVSLPLENTQYVIEVRSNCGATTTGWSAKLIATTGSSMTVAARTVEPAEEVEVEIENILRETILYPNPVQNGSFSINLDPQLEGPIDVKIISLDGRRYTPYLKQVSSQSYEVSVTGYSAGVYVVELSAGSNSIRQKLVIKN